MDWFFPDVKTKSLTVVVDFCVLLEKLPKIYLLDKCDPRTCLGQALYRLTEPHDFKDEREDYFHGCGFSLEPDLVNGPL